MGNFFEDVIKGDPRFHSTKPVNDPALLEPRTRAAVSAIIADAAANGVQLMVYETYRSQERQALLFEQKVTQLQTVGVHHYGLACDLVKSVGGEPSWKGDFSIIGHLAVEHLLVWGGDWGRPDLPHTFRDFPHVQRCSVADQAKLFRGEFYPDDQYNPLGARTIQLVYRLTDPMMSGEKIRAIQQALTAAGFDAGGADGVFGKQTRSAVIAFQTAKGLTPNGEVATSTATALGIQL